MAVFVFNTPQLFINTPQPVILPKTMNTGKELLPKNKLSYWDRNILHYLYTNPRLCDIEFIVNDKRFPANRYVMSAASVVFEAMLFGTFQESSRSKIKISDVIHTESFSSLLSYIYGFGIQVDSLRIEVIMEVLKLGHLYELPKLCEALQSYVSKLDLEIQSEHSFGTDAFMELLNVAFTYKIFDLYDTMKNIIKSSTENVNKFLEHSELVNIKSPILVDIFEADNFCTDEVKILGAVLKWIDENTTETDCSSVFTMDKKHNVITSEEHILESCDSGINVSSENPPKKKRKNDTLVGESLPSIAGMKLPSHISLCLKNIDHSENNEASGSCTINTNDESSGDFGTKTHEEVVSLEHESNGTPLDECNKGSDDQHYSSKKKTPTGILGLLQTIRSPRMSTFDIYNFWKQNGSLCKKYEHIVTDMTPCLNNKNPRKPLIQKRILMLCDNYIYKSLYTKTSAPVIYDSLKFYLKVTQNAQDSCVSVQLAVQDLDCNCSQAERSVSLNYSLFLKSFHPFYTGYFVERNKALCTTLLKKPKPTPIVCSHDYYGPFRSCSNCRNQSNIITSETNPAVIAVTSKLPNTLNQISKGFIKNSSFILEAFIEFN